MKEDWLKEIRDRMAEYEADEPAGLWEQIARARGAEGAGPVGRPARPAVLLWAGRIAAVAAAVALVLTIGYYMVGNEKPSALVTTEGPGAEPVKAGGNPAVRDEVKENNLPAEPNPGSSKYAEASSAHVASRLRPQTEGVHAYSDPDPAEAPGQDDTATTAGDDAVPESPTPVDEQPRIEAPGRQNTGQNHQYNNYIAQANTGRKRSGRLSLGVFTTGGAGSSFNRKYAGNNLVLHDTASGANGANWEGSPMLGILTFNRDRDVERDIKHRLPLRTGISFSYRLNERISIESGVTYANLTSDLRDGSRNHYFTGKQTLHYVGIPLSLKYRVVSWGGFDMYASAGVLAEKSVSGKLRTRYVLNSKPQNTETANLNVKPMQWSAAVSAGVQYNIAPAVGIYAEPGVGYYFDNGSPVKTIYKDKPLNFNLNLGIRLNLGLQ